MAIRFIEELIHLTQGIPEIHNWSLATFYSVLVAIMSLLAFLKPNIKKANSDGRTAALPVIATATGTSVSAVTKLFESLNVSVEGHGGPRWPMSRAGAMTPCAGGSCPFYWCVVDVC
ncbi:hypothetical protein VOLCADRAFT_92867 [Volvox carteri f. nagariensis]|uniref:Uncharacterized protein n=1 Tax=Volvox carteri f. nagariensis TaxID=3068 RepID=D8U0N9_VOLCA|nr:uncharacterized protein VOLCADRAFT_92867 [Volvox carteri f. nagariensis]EFJ46669.1 hypothetical protein VOLCADRAFT_92867 [Volvox carteri f. nagariensis]|eukprot:XP_002952198.1 hypothetical protein VOLCADRAFT_92867 [Volvox carteri f. nagariensis]